MELNLVPLIEAARGITWPGALVILGCLLAACYMARLRLVHGDRERAFWREATPEQIQARAATTATLPKPTKAPPSPAAPLVMLAVFLGCALVPASGSQPSILVRRHKTASMAEDWIPSAEAVELARVGTGEPGQTPAPGRVPPGPVRKDCSPVTCKPPSYCSGGVCQNAARKPPPHKLAGSPASPSSVVVRETWRDVEPEAFPAPMSDSQWLTSLRY